MYITGFVITIIQSNCIGMDWSCKLQFSRFAYDKFLTVRMIWISCWSCAWCICSVDPFTKKDWYDVKAPSMFNTRNIGKTIVTRTIGTSSWYFFSCLYYFADVKCFFAWRFCMCIVVNKCFHVEVLSTAGLGHGKTSTDLNRQSKAFMLKAIFIFYFPNITAMITNLWMWS